MMIDNHISQLEKSQRHKFQIYSQLQVESVKSEKSDKIRIELKIGKSVEIGYFWILYSSKSPLFQDLGLNSSPLFQDSSTLFQDSSTLFQSLDSSNNLGNTSNKSTMLGNTSKAMLGNTIQDTSRCDFLVEGFTLNHLDFDDLSRVSSNVDLMIDLICNDFTLNQFVQFFTSIDPSRNELELNWMEKSQILTLVQESIHQSNNKDSIHQSNKKYPEIYIFLLCQILDLFNALPQINFYILLANNDQITLFFKLEGPSWLSLNFIASSDKQGFDLAQSTIDWHDERALIQNVPQYTFPDSIIDYYNQISQLVSLNNPKSLGKVKNNLIRKLHATYQKYALDYDQDSFYSFYIYINQQDQMIGACVVNGIDFLLYSNLTSQII